MTAKDPNHNNSANRIRLFRKIHRQIAIVAFVFFGIVSVTGLLLGWKKNSFGLILPKETKGLSTDLKTWLPLDSLYQLAVNTLHDSISPALSARLERIDARPGKGMVKFVFADDYWEVQLDGTTGKVLLVDRRMSDIIENIHDGTILDVIFNTRNDPFKLIYTSVMGISLLTLTVTGFWLWLGPKRLRKKKMKPER